MGNLNEKLLGADKPLKWVSTKNYNTDDIVHSQEADSTIHKIYRCIQDHLAGVQVLTDIAFWVPIGGRPVIEDIIDPVVGDDDVAGYLVGDLWINTLTDTSFILVDNGTAAAIWQEIGSGLFIRDESGFSAVLKPDYLSGAALLADDFLFGATPNAALDPLNYNLLAVGEENRMFFDKDIGAFRAGYNDDGGWDLAVRGANSTAFGNGTIASGTGSTAWGDATFASGGASTAWGSGAVAVGFNSTAFGNGTIAGGFAITGTVTVTGTAVTLGTTLSTQLTNGDNVVIDGQTFTINALTPTNGTLNTAIDTNGAGKQIYTGAGGAGVFRNYSTAFGDTTIASGEFSTAWGLRAIASGSASTAFGQDTEASNTLATAWGRLTAASGTRSTAWGLSTEASETQATAWGRDNTAGADNATVWGQDNTSGTAAAIGVNSTVWGRNNSNSSDTSTVFGSGVLFGNAVDGSVGIGLGGAGANAANLWELTTPGNMIIMGGQVLIDDQTAGPALLAPTATLDLVGTFRYADTNQAAGKVLTSDANGVASWADAAAAGALVDGVGTGAMESNGITGTVADADAQGDRSIALGDNASTAAIGFDSIAIGTGATANEASGVAVGVAAESDEGGVAIGRAAVTDGPQGVAVGSESASFAGGIAVGNGADARAGGVSVGQGAGGNSTSGQSVFVGKDAGAGGGGGGTGGQNTAVGHLALASYLNANSNTAMGYFAAVNLTTGHRNTVMGFESARNTTTGADNTLIGYEAGGNVKTRNFNVAIGRSAGQGNGAGTGGGANNVSVGASALRNNEFAATNNIAIGFQAGLAVTTGTSNTLLGSDADIAVGTQTNSIAIGRTAIVDASNKMRIGNDSLTTIEVAPNTSFITKAASNGSITIAPDGTGTINLVDGTEVGAGAGAVWTQAAADGVGGWAAAAGGGTFIVDTTGDNNDVVTPDSGISTIATDDFLFGAPVFAGVAPADDPLDYDGLNSIRMFFDKSKGAFRVGDALTEWDDINRGSSSMAWGINTTASGAASTSWGNLTTASDNYATAFGIDTDATAQSATAFGSGTIASGTNSTAFGQNTTAFGARSTASGNGTASLGGQSTSWGSASVAGGFAISGTVTVVAGASALVGDGTALFTTELALFDNIVVAGEQFNVIAIADDNNLTLSGNHVAGAGGVRVYTGIGGGFFQDHATAFGNGTTASGPGCTAWGQNTIASGIESTAWGFSTEATGTRSTAWGFSTEASGIESTAWGSSTEATGPRSTAWGFSTEAIGSHSTTFGFRTIASGLYSTAWGDQAEAIGARSTAFGFRTIASGLVSTAWGRDAQASGFYSTAWGRDTQASGAQSTAFGLNTQASNDQATAWGSGAVAVGFNSTAFGSGAVAGGYAITGTVTVTGTAVSAGTNLLGELGAGPTNIVIDGQTFTITPINAATGTLNAAIDTDGAGKQIYTGTGGAGVFQDNATAWGSTSTASGPDSTAFGSATASGPQSLAFGFQTTASNGSATAFGAFSTATGAHSTAFGNNSHASADRATAWGTFNLASGTESTAWGFSNTAAGETSTVFGSGMTLSAAADGSVGIGLGGLGVNPANTFTSADAGVMTIAGGSVLIDTAVGAKSITASSALEVNSTTGAILFPRMTDAEKLLLTGTNGMIIYDTDVVAGGEFQGFVNGAWVSLGGGGGGYTWTTQTAAYVAADNDGVLADTITAGAFTLTLPDNPAQGEKIKIMDGALAGGFSTNNLTVAVGLGGATILNTASPFIMDTDFGWVEAVYEAASNDWRLMGPGVGPSAAASGWTSISLSASQSAVADEEYITDGTAGITITCPTPALGLRFRVIDGADDWATDNVTIAPFAGEQIDFVAANLVLNVDRAWVELVSDGTNWFVYRP